MLSIKTFHKWCILGEVYSATASIIFKMNIDGSRESIPSFKMILILMFIPLMCLDD